MWPAVISTILMPLAMPALPAFCKTASTATSAAGKITVQDVDGAEGAYRRLRVATSRGAHLTVLYDRGSEAEARRWSPCLGTQIAMLRDITGDDRPDAEWASVVFTQNAAYMPDRKPRTKVRWIVAVQPDGSLSPKGYNSIVTVIPHEQVHDFQGRSGSRLPRWFGEGHASWAGDSITARIDPAAIDAARRERAGELAKTTGPLELAAWGGVRPKREAIMRQVSAEDRARMEREPNYMPGGSFSFTPDDLIGDETKMPARYAASVAIFRTLEQRYGAAKVRDFARQASAVAGPVTPARLGELTRQSFGLSLDAVLALGDDKQS